MNLQIFQNQEFGEIRTVMIEDKPYFVASDIAKALGYVNAQDAIKKHCRWVAKCDIPHPQSKTKTLAVNVIPEGDLYRLITHSELPSAEKFESWVFDEVLPSIRKNGGYIANQENLSPEQIVANALVVAQNIIQQKDKQLEEQRPKVIFADAVTASDKSILIGELAKIIKQNGVEMGEKRLFTWLRDKGYLIKRNGTDYNAPTQRSMELGLFTVKETAITHADGHVTVSKTTKVTGRGQSYFINKFLGNAHRG